MNESIIRRFAKYHGRHYAITHPGIGTDEAIADLAEHLRTTERNVIQSITRIEDAEMLIGDADGLEMEIGPAGRFTTLDEHGSRVLSAAANRLFAKGGIDPAKWREVKE